MDDFLKIDGDEDDIRLNAGIDDPFAFRAEPEETSEPAQVIDIGQPAPVEGDAVEELSELLQGFKGRAARENQRYVDAVDSEYWIALCFQTREQKEEFLTKLKLMDLGDKYLDGMEVAKVLGIKLESRIPSMPQPRPFDQEYVRMADDF